MGRFDAYDFFGRKAKIRRAKIYHDEKKNFSVIGGARRVITLWCEMPPVASSSSRHYYYYLVSRYGFPPGQGEIVEERRGPHIYVLARVEQMHFEEINPNCTVTLCDTGADQRADMRSKRGEMAVLRAARDSSEDHHWHWSSLFLDGGGGGGGLLEQESMRTLRVPGKFSQCLQNACYFLLPLFLRVLDGLRFIRLVFLSQKSLVPLFSLFLRSSQAFSTRPRAAHLSNAIDHGQLCRVQHMVHV